jgi:hypothetical protein
MAETTKHACPPYATFAPLLNILNKLRDTQVPNRIDPSVFKDASGSLIYSVLAALKVLKLIGPDGTPYPAFVDLVKADDEARKPLMLEALQAAYPTFFDGSFDIKKATAGQFDEHIRDNYEAKGSTIDKVAAFFIAAANYTGLEVSELVKERKPISSSASSGKSKKQRRQGSDNGGTATPPAPPAAPMSNTAMEYKLVDLMKELDIGDDERSAIWTLIQYLTRKKKAAGQ